MHVGEKLALRGISVGFLLVACSSDSGFAPVEPEAGADHGSGGSGGSATSGAGNVDSGGRVNAGGTSAGAANAGGTSAGGTSAAGASAGGGTSSDAGGYGGSSGGTPATGGRSPDAGAPDAGDASSSEDAATPADGGDASARVNKRIFLTHDRWEGDLNAAANDLGINVTTGLAAADALCNRSATDAALGGTWVAWLSDSTHDAIDRVADVGPWYRIDGAEVFADKAALAGNPLVPITVDETGADTENGPDAGGLANIPWTGTRADGTHAADTCNNWLSNAGNVHGMAGANNSTVDRVWSEGTVPLCFRPYHLYCFEQ